ncbi:MAG TPA: uroporphyrinogen decarboxylase family protein [Armatimonadota bacterium]|jgi:hypothetical protein
MTRRERLMATLRGEAVDRPAVSFYEVGGFTVDPSDPDPFNIYNSPSWQPLLRLAEEKTDLIRMVGPALAPAPGNRRGEFITEEAWEGEGSRFRRTTVRVAGRTLTSVSRRDPGTDTTWTTEHLLKDADDLCAYLELPDEVFDVVADIRPLVDAEAKVGDAGILMVDTGDALAEGAALFSMDDFMVLAFTEKALFHKLLEKLAAPIQRTVERVAREFPGRLWRIYGPEYAAEPYLPSRLFNEFVVRYDQPLVQAIEGNGGFCRIHCHGRVKAVLPAIVEMGASAIDPLEPLPQGDVTLAEVRREFGKDLVLFGNLEASDLENLEPAEFAPLVDRALEEGTSGEGRGFVLMPSASPYGRDITRRTMANYETMVEKAAGRAR